MVATNVLRPDIFVPGRATIIGEHTDYNEGVSLAIALSLGVRVSLHAPTSNSSLQFLSDELGEFHSTDPPTQLWHRQALAAIRELTPEPSSVRVRSSVPLGVGLSSSAAFLGALVLAFGAVGNLEDVAHLVQRCEHEAGSPVGLLDPLATLGPLADHALSIHFADATLTDVAWPNDLALSAVFSGVARTLADSSYRTRREECAAAGVLMGGWSSASLDQLSEISDPLLRARARHVLSENERVPRVITALGRLNFSDVGDALNESHRSLRDDFAVSTKEIDHLVDALSGRGGVYGARLLGGGFGGCILVAHEPGVMLQEFGQPVWPLVVSPGAFALLGRVR